MLTGNQRLNDPVSVTFRSKPGVDTNIISRQQRRQFATRVFHDAASLKAQARKEFLKLRPKVFFVHLRTNARLGTEVDTQLFEYFKLGTVMTGRTLWRARIFCRSFSPAKRGSFAPISVT